MLRDAWTWSRYCGMNTFACESCLLNIRICWFITSAPCIDTWIVLIAGVLRPNRCEMRINIKHNWTDVTLWLIDPKHKGCANGIPQIVLHSTHRFHWKAHRKPNDTRCLTPYFCSWAAEQTSLVCAVISFSSWFASELTSLRRLRFFVQTTRSPGNPTSHMLWIAIKASDESGDCQFWM